MATIHEISSEWQIEGLSPTWVKVHKSVVEYDLAQSRIRALEAERDALAADAARYRRLFTGDKVYSRFRKVYDFWDGADGKAGFDRAFDEVMKGE